MLVAVYGTLKQGYGNNRYLQGKTLVGTGRTKKHLTMINAGFPVIIDRKKSKKKQHQVRVEVYDIGDDQICLQNMDRLEGEGHMYHRRVTTILMDDGRKLECSIYIGDDRWLQRYRPEDTHSFLRPSGHLVWPDRERERLTQLIQQRQPREIQGETFRVRMPRSGEQDDTGA